MKKTAAILASIAALSLCTTSAFAANGDNIVDGVLNGAEDVVDGVISGAEEIITPGGSTGAVEENTSNDTSRPVTESTVTPGTTSNVGNTGNVNTGVPVYELAALGAAAVGGLATMAVTVRKRK